MDIAQLKLLAARIRALLTEANRPVGHNQSLDLSAALPGLRNWPEVIAFPDHVAACVLDEAAAGRLAHRLKRKLDLSIDAGWLLGRLSPEPRTAVKVPQVWPSGPRAGVYVTTSPEAIKALLRKYDEATDGAVVYAERAGSHWDGSIDLGEYGLWSGGLERVASGTLLVVGPVDLDQQSWKGSAERIEMAEMQAYNNGHRVAVLLRTPTPESLCEDVALIVRLAAKKAGASEDAENALVGTVSEEGELEERVPFARAWPRYSIPSAQPVVDAIPEPALAPLRSRLEGCCSGYVLVGSNIIDGNWWAADLVAALVGLTDAAGPAARIMPRRRSTPEKFFQVPESLRQLPFLPSIDSAYAQGFRRMVVDPNYNLHETLSEHVDDVLFLIGSHGRDVVGVYSEHWARFGGPDKEQWLLRHLVAALGVKHLPAKRGRVSIADLYVAPRPISVPDDLNRKDGAGFLAENRLLRWEDAAEALLRAGQMSATTLKKNVGRDFELKDFLEKRVTGARRAALEGVQ